MDTPPPLKQPRKQEKQGQHPLIFFLKKQRFLCKNGQITQHPQLFKALHIFIQLLLLLLSTAAAAFVVLLLVPFDIVKYALSIGKCYIPHSVSIAYTQNSYGIPTITPIKGNTIACYCYQNQVFFMDIGKCWKKQSESAYVVLAQPLLCYGIRSKNTGKSMH